MFLKSITINNYKSIQKATVGFEHGLNIIIGKNGAGKSNLLQFINQNVSYYTIAGRLNRNINLEYEFAICYEDEELITELIIYLKRDRIVLNGEIELSNEVRVSKSINGNFQFKDKAIKIIKKEKDRTTTIELYEFLKEIDFVTDLNKTVVSFTLPNNSAWLDKPNKYEIDIELFPDSEDYYNEVAIFFELGRMINIGFSTQEDLKFENLQSDNVRKIFLKIFNDFNEDYQLNHNLSKFSPIQEIRINPNINIYNVDNKILVENLLIDFKVNDKWIPWSYLSDGSKRLFYLITQCLSLKDGLLLIEEPELGIHPHQLFHLMNFLKEQSEEKQIIISTHSPMVLDILRPDELNRITIAKIEHNGSQFYKLTDRQIALAKEYMQDVADLSDYWVHSDLENNYAETND